MLVLSRKKNESIIINDNVSVKIIEIRGDKVRIGIEADAGVPVHRKEIWLAIQKEKEKEQAMKDENEKLLTYVEEIAQENLQLRSLLEDK